MNGETSSNDYTILADAQTLVGDVYSRVINSNTIVDCETYVYGMYVMMGNNYDSTELSF